ncbi:MAG: hypothetical protein AB7U85_04805 [Alphaproteobacteria bacterium]
MSNKIERPLDDHYITPPEVVRALLSVEPFMHSKIWEPCAGTGELAETLRSEGRNVYASTIQSKEFYNKELPDVDCGVDFLKQTRMLDNCKTIITNPPYGRLYGKKDKLAVEKIIRHAVSLRFYKMAMLLPMSFLGGIARKEGLFKELPPSSFYQFSNRIKMYPAGIDVTGKNTPLNYYGWFVWQAGEMWKERKPEFAGWLNSNEFKEHIVKRN